MYISQLQMSSSFPLFPHVLSHRVFTEVFQQEVESTFVAEES